MDKIIKLITNDVPFYYLDPPNTRVAIYAINIIRPLSVPASLKLEISITLKPDFSTMHLQNFQTLENPKKYNFSDFLYF